MLKRDKKPCKCCERGTDDESHPKVELLLGKADEALKSSFLGSDRDTTYDPDNTPDVVSVIESVDDQTDAGYIVDQKPKGGQIIIHTRTQQKGCAAQRVTMVARMKDLSEDVGQLPDEEQARKLETIARLLSPYNKSGNLNRRIASLLLKASNLGGLQAMSTLAVAYKSGDLGLNSDVTQSHNLLRDVIQRKEQQAMTAGLDNDYQVLGEVLAMPRPVANIPDAMCAFAKAVQYHTVKCRDGSCGWLGELKDKQESMLSSWVEGLPNSSSLIDEEHAMSSFDVAQSKAETDKPEAIKGYLDAASKATSQERQQAWVKQARTLFQSLIPTRQPSVIRVIRLGVIPLDAAQLGVNPNDCSIQ